MKLFLYIIFLFLFPFFGLTQIPEGYYDSTKDLDDNALKEALYQIIKDHVEFPYTSSSTDVWDILKETDKDPNNPDNVILLYTGWSVDAAQEWNSGSGWSREHVWSKSHGDFGTDEGAGTDVHHLRPADPTVNSAKNNRWFDECSEPYEDGGEYTGCFKGAEDWTWMPREEVKGDVARMIFYMAVRYEGENEEPDLEIVDFLPEDNNTSDSIYAKLSTLYQWHLDDPVSDWERKRNDVIYYNFQNNRNPFIDHPEFANYIYGGESPSDSNPPPPPTLEIDDKNDRMSEIRIEIIDDTISIKELNSNDQLVLRNALGQLITTKYAIDNTETRIDISLLENGLCYLQIISGDEIFYKTLVIMK